MTTEAHKKARAKWNAQNVRSIATSIRIEEKEKFRQYAEARGTTMSALLLAYIRKCINSEENNTEE